MSRGFCAAALFVGVLCVLPGAAGAEKRDRVAVSAERIQDGGFEGSTCDATECTNPAWTDSVTTAFANATGPICRSGTGSGNTDCNGGGSVPFAGSTWVRLGAGFKATAMFGGGVISALEQTVAIPTAPATLSFRLRIINAAVPAGTFNVNVGGTEVFGATDVTVGFAAYAPVTIDLSSFAGTTPLVAFEGVSSAGPVGALDSFDVDDVSLTTVDPRCAVLRAKLKRAKGKKGRKAKQKRRKLRKKLKQLGC
jgi:hypothetical protein